jgi:hypothetical protein
LEGRVTAPEVGCPPASNISEKLTASRASLGQNKLWDVIIAPLPVPEFGEPLFVHVAILHDQRLDPFQRTVL